MEACMRACMLRWRHMHGMHAVTVRACERAAEAPQSMHACACWSDGCPQPLGGLHALRDGMIVNSAHSCHSSDARPMARRYLLLERQAC